MADGVWDVVIVGGGPAGLTAALYAARARLKTLVVEKGRAGGQAATTEKLENYPGVLECSGPELMDRFAEQARHFGAELVRDEIVAVSLRGPDKVVTGKKGEYRAKALILCPGAEPRVLGIKGERAFRGKGVSYCATCDADFYSDLEVVVVGNGDAAIEEAMYLAKFAAKVTIIVIHEAGKLDATRVIQERAFAHPKLAWVWNSVLEEIGGDGLVEQVVVRNIQSGALSTLPTQGVFFFVGTVPRTGFLKGALELDEQGYLVTGESMDTPVPGVYAAGDARQKQLRQIITAASDGAIAACAAEKFLQEEEGFRRQVLEAASPVLVYFWSPQSEESLRRLGVIDEVRAAVGPGVGLVKIDVSRSARIAARYGVGDVPLALLFQGGEVTRRLDGDTLRKWVPT
ncbi:MAG TPA: thioredoxin-disulfide reductase [Clostridiales bacterium UBA8153]|nr:thioredoxin-disulfide reductase [Clostridiales bacterium UBA8153]